VAELSEVDRRDHDRYWNNIENTITQSDRRYWIRKTVSYWHSPCSDTVLLII